MSVNCNYLCGLADYYLSEDLSDITFLIDGNEVFAHKFLLAAESPVFKKMLFGDFKEKNDKEIELKETPLDAFKLFLKYLYCQGFDLAQDISNDHLLAIKMIELSHRFQINRLTLVIEKILIKMISNENLTMICEVCILYDLNQLLNAMKQFVVKNAQQLFDDKYFITDSIETMATILGFIGSEKFPQNLIISALTEIIAANPGNDLKPFMKSINFDLCTIDDMEALRKLNIFSDTELYNKLENKYRKYCQKVKETFYSHTNNHSRQQSNQIIKPQFSFGQSHFASTSTTFAFVQQDIKPNQENICNKVNFDFDS
jgi:hypothetical protein